MTFKGTTIVAVKKNGHVAIAGDGQVTMGDSVIIKGNAKKIRKIFNDKILIGFAGTTADAFTLFELFEKKLKQYNGDLTRAAVELAKEWRTDRNLRKLEALMLCTDGKEILMISGNGDVLEPEYDAIGIGSGGNYAYAAARAMLENTDLNAKEIAQKAIHIAGDICVFTDHTVRVEEL